MLEIEFSTFLILRKSLKLHLVIWKKKSKILEIHSFAEEQAKIVNLKKCDILSWKLLLSAADVFYHFLVLNQSK